MHLNKQHKSNIARLSVEHWTALAFFAREFEATSFFPSLAEKSRCQNVVLSQMHFAHGMGAHSVDQLENRGSLPVEVSPVRISAHGWLGLHAFKCVLAS